MGIIPIFRKELADHLGSRRFAILFALIVLAGVSASYVAAQSIQPVMPRTAPGTSVMPLPNPTAG
jgi:membrane associated rhomboid family serine protease